MRGFFAFLAFSAVLIGMLLLVVVPWLARPLVVDAVRAALPFGDQPVDVGVELDGPGLLAGYVGEIRLSGGALAAGDASIGTLDVAVRRVALGGRQFEAMDGTLRDVAIPLDDGSTLVVESVALSGPSTDVRAQATIRPADAEALVSNTLVSVGLIPDQVLLVEGGVQVDLLGQRVVLPLITDAGAIVIESLMGFEAVPVVAPRLGDPWAITSVVVRASGLEIVASVDAEALLAEG
jgi:hypothetical protein